MIGSFKVVGNLQSNMGNANIELPVEIAASLLTFIQDNMQVKGKDGAQALIMIIAAFEKAIETSTNEELNIDADF